MKWTAADIKILSEGINSIIKQTDKISNKLKDKTSKIIYPKDQKEEK
jgi:hypothetical protein